MNAYWYLQYWHEDQWIWSILDGPWPTLEEAIEYWRKFSIKSPGVGLSFRFVKTEISDIVMCDIL